MAAVIWVMNVVLILRYTMDCNQVFDLNIQASKSLVCYQCNSSSTDALPSCQIGYFEYNKPWKKMNFAFQCPPHISNYCFIMENKIGDVIKTVRGCYGGKDHNDRDLKSGCMIEENQTMCFCNNVLCNTALVKQYFICYYFLILIWYFIH